jgi:hypothetical protein
MWRNTRHVRRGGAAWIVAAAILGTSFPATAAAGPSAPLLLKKKKKPRRSRSGKPKDAVTPADAAAKRAPAQARGQALVAQGEFTSAGIEFDNAAAELGDPVLYIDAGEAYLGGANEARDPELARAAIERGRISLDILYFHLDAGVDPHFRLVETSDVPALIVRAQKVIEDAEALIEELEAEVAAAEEPEKKKKKKKRKRRKIDRDKALLISGAVITAVGIGFAGLGGAGLALGYKHQLDADHPAVYGDEYDAVAAKGRRANMMAYVGLPVGGALLATGIALLVVAKRGSKKKPAEEKVTLSPTFAPGSSGVALSGRF